MESKVSVIIPFIDRDKDLLQRSRGSAEAQTYPVHEIITVYDKDLRGIAYARNTGFEQSTGDFILPLDCDDWIEPTYIEKTLARMTEGVGIVSTDFMYHCEDDKAKDRTILRDVPQTYETELQMNRITVTSLVRREAREKAGEWDAEVRGWEDWDMWLRILKLGYKHDVVPEVLFHYRLHNGGMNAWANQKENKQKLYGYLLSKHPGFGVIRQSGKKWNEI